MKPPTNTASEQYRALSIKRLICTRCRVRFESGIGAETALGAAPEHLDPCVRMLRQQLEDAQTLERWAKAQVEARTRALVIAEERLAALTKGRAA